MKNNIRTALFLVLLATILSVLPVMAAPPLAVHIQVEEYINTSGETFYASGPAIDAGAICATGSVYDEFVGAADAGSSLRILRIIKHFDCADGSGTFDVSMIVQLDLVTNETTARWRLTGGSGDYAGLHGNGSLTGDPIDPGESILDVYDGQVYKNLVSRKFKI